MSEEALIVTIFFLVPGFLAVQLFRFLLVEEDLTTFELTTWSLIYSVLGIMLLWTIPVSRSASSYLFQPSLLEGAPLASVGLQILASCSIALVAGWGIRKFLGGRLGPHAFFRRSWDYLWARHGQEDRYALVQTDDELLYGQLYFADGATAGHDIVLANPYQYDADADDFFSSGYKFTFVRGSLVRSVSLMVASEPTEDDKPLPTPGYLSDHLAGTAQRKGAVRDEQQ